MLTIVVCYFMTELFGAFMIPRAASERASKPRKNHSKASHTIPRLVYRTIFIVTVGAV